MFNNDISIDLGTATVLVYIKNKGIVLREPTVIAVNTKTNEVCAVGKDALAMLGRTPPHIQAVRPLIDGVISNLTLTQEMIKHFFSKIFSRTIGHPRIMMCVPSGVTDVEQRAVIEAARDVGAKDIYIIEEPVAAALGAGFDISRPHGTMVVDIGGGTTDIAVLSLGGIVVSRSLKIAGDEFNDVKAVKGEKPIKANGKLMVIDGGFSKAYQPETGIAGYTLVYHSRGFQLVQHEPFTSTQKAIEEGLDIKSTTQIVEMSSKRMMVKDTDKGRELSIQINDLKKLLVAYRTGTIKEKSL